jgi:tetratricopeptide (TPR) repeat protein
MRNLAFVEGRWNEALETGRRIESKVGPDSPFMTFVYATRTVHAVTVGKDKEAAREAIRRFAAVSKEPEKEKQVLFYEGLVAEKLDGDDAVAERKYREALAECHEKDLVVTCVTGLARLRSNRGEWTGAASLLEQAFALDPENVSLTWNLAEAYRKAGVPEKAEPLLEKLREKTGDPNLGKE